jgi:hypothetical protein
MEPRTMRTASAQRAVRIAALELERLVSSTA